MQPNYYETLEVSPAASGDVIKMAYRGLARKYHPDLYKGDKDFAEEKMREINEAYRILSNPSLKADFDLKLKTENISRQQASRDAGGSNAPPKAQQTTQARNCNDVRHEAYSPGPQSHTQAQSRSAAPHQASTSPADSQSPPIQKQAPKEKGSSPLSGCLENLVETVVTIIVIVLIANHFLSGKGISLFSYLPKGFSPGSVIQTLKEKTYDEDGPEQCVSNYLDCLKNGDQETAHSLVVPNSSSSEMTDLTYLLYTESFYKKDAPFKFCHNEIMATKEFTYSLGNKTFDGNKKAVTIEATITNIDLYAVSLLVNNTYYERISDDGWVMNYLANAAMKGELLADDDERIKMRIYEDTFDEYLHSDKLTKLNAKVSFHLEQIDGGWKIRDVTENSDFIAALSGKWAYVLKDLGVYEYFVEKGVLEK